MNNTAQTPTYYEIEPVEYTRAKKVTAIGVALQAQIMYSAFQDKAAAVYQVLNADGVPIDTGNEVVSIEGWEQDDMALIHNLCDKLGFVYVGIKTWPQLQTPEAPAA